MRKRLIQSIDALPCLKGYSNLIMDLETTSEDDTLMSTNPWHNCKTLGIAFGVDDCEKVYYIPLRHRGYLNKYQNLPIEPVKKWLVEQLGYVKAWINHNIKYDIHALRNSDGVDIRDFPHLTLVDTLTKAKLRESDRFSYALDLLAKYWLYRDISSFEQRLKTFLNGRKDYGLVPIDTMCDYACEDVITTKDLNDLCDEDIPAECSQIVSLEQQITKELVTIEINGLKLDRKRTVVDYIKIPVRLKKLQDELVNKTGHYFRPNTNADCYELLCDRYGLPVLEYTDASKKKYSRSPSKWNPSFSKDALAKYLQFDKVPRSIIKGILLYRKYRHLYNLFVESYAELHVDGVLHSDYNQIVDTGRFSCRQPNAQQLSLLAKRYIEPLNEDYCILDIDLSQIEFRTIVHYINDLKAIRSYRTDPKTDFHEWIQKQCDITRHNAKTMNFRIGYGGGKNGVVSQLKTDPDIIKSGVDPVARGEELYDLYHKTLPSLKPTMWKASNVVRTRGFTRTILGRHRHLPAKAHFKAFNTVCQGTAADIMKLITCRICILIRAKYPDVYLVAIVHDSWVFQCPLVDREEFTKDVCNLIEGIEKEIGFRVPIIAKAKWSVKNWADCES